MLRYGRGMIRIAELAINSINYSRTCFGRVRQFSQKLVTCRPLRFRSTLVGYNGYDTSDQKVAQKGSVVEHLPVPWSKVVYASDPVVEKHVSENVRVYEDFISEDEESSLVDEVQPYLKRLKYEHDHWDDVSIFVRRI